jgi:hypothetical protein
VLTPTVLILNIIQVLFLNLSLRVQGVRSLHDINSEGHTMIFRREKLSKIRRKKDTAIYFQSLFLEHAGFTNFTKFLIRILLSFYHVAQAPRRTLVGLYQHIPTNSVGESGPSATLVYIGLGFSISREIHFFFPF